MGILRALQEEMVPWQQRNFAARESWQPLMGVSEEVGELSHAHLKRYQRIRGTIAEHDEKGRDAVGDILIYLADYCNAMGWDMESCLRAAWGEVKDRDWIAYPKNGRTE